ncbi:HlyD family efflux transporter periplasmic adaptor subunit [Maridesulfovibrio sp.]|uniref:HlyD family secretion protein n=1 Tax=Maridesulfovibrio sp. TaxID=2795000 RepID=UPI0029CA6B31|nr:HlyD family efflux transporter periplasmic adaptor subunit [Maridesulfovibrio sp.]
MAIDERKTVKFEQQAIAASVRHPIKAAKLLYSVPSFILRGPIYIVFLLLVTLVVYSFWARKDVLVTAPMTIVTESTTIQAIGGGQITDIRVGENSYVNSGDMLLLIQEQTRAGMDTEQESFDARISELEREKEKASNEYSHKLSQFKLELDDMVNNRGTRKISLEGQIAQLRTRINSAARERDLRQKEYKTSAARYQRMKKRYEARDITVTQFESARSDYERRRSAVSDAQASVSELSVQLNTLRNQLSNLQDQHGADKLKKEILQLELRRDRELKRFDDRLAGMRERQEKAQQLIEGVSFDETSTEYAAVFDGLVTNVHVSKGELVSLGAPLITLVKDTAALEGQLLVMNKDIGKLEIGQRVKIKYFAFPYQEYGIPEGTIYDIAKRPGGVDGQESMYLVKVALDEETIKRVGSSKSQPLEIGLEGIAEVKTGEKRWIEMFFTPISQFFNKDSEE